MLLTRVHDAHDTIHTGASGSVPIQRPACSTPGSWPHRAARWLFLLLVLLMVPSACKRGDDGSPKAAGWKPNVDGNVMGVRLRDVEQAIVARVSSDDRPAAVDSRQWKRVRQLYSTYGDTPLWFDGDGLTDRARALAHTLTEASEEGLHVDAYPLDEIVDALTVVHEADRPTADQLAHADLIFTATYVALAEDLLGGQIDPRSVSPSWHIDPHQTDVDSAVARALSAQRFDQALSGLRPQDSSYAVLRRELANYRELAAAGGWTIVPEGKAVKPGEQAPAAQLRALRSRLASEGYLPADAATADSAPAAGRELYDRALAGVVATFQADHAIEVDSILGGQTISSLNLPASFRADQIAANMERHRWLPHALGSRFVLVNVPAFQMQAFENGRMALEMKVVVGEEYDDKATPTFSDSMSTVVFRPYWNVPDGIAEREIYPKLEADPSYFERRNFETFTEGGRTHVRQKPGGDNSLGLVKFLFPNEFAIYLHDTPDSSTFARDVRAASHGCIRLERPASFAQWVLGWDAEKVQEAMNTGPDDQKVSLDRKIPVYIVYFTAFARDGKLLFGNDLYDRDAALVRHLAKFTTADSSAQARVEKLKKLISSVD